MNVRSFLIGTCILGLAAATASGDANVRVLHASPDAPAVDVAVNDGFTPPAIEDLGFGMLTPYTALPAGTQNFKVVPANTLTPVVIDADVPLVDGMSYTVAAIDFLGAGTTLTPYLIEDTGTTPAAGNAALRIHHLSPDAGVVDVDAVGVGTLAGGVGYASSTGYIEVPAGTYDIEINGASYTVPFDDVMVSAGVVYDIFAIGSALGAAGAEPFTLKIVPEPTTLASLLVPGLMLLRRRA